VSGQQQPCHRHGETVVRKHRRQQPMTALVRHRQQRTIIEQIIDHVVINIRQVHRLVFVHRRRHTTMFIRRKMLGHVHRHRHHRPFDVLIGHGHHLAARRRVAFVLHRRHQPSTKTSLGRVDNVARKLRHPCRLVIVRHRHQPTETSLVHVIIIVQ
jgi:hypothetical protein